MVVALNVEGLGLLSCMGVFLPGIDKELLVELTSQTILGQHAFNGKAEKIFGALLEKIFGSNGLDATNITGVTVVRLRFELVAGQLDLIRVDDDDLVTAINVGSVHGVVLTTNASRYNGSESAKHLILGINHVPFLWIVRFLCAIGIFFQCCLLPVVMIVRTFVQITEIK